MISENRNGYGEVQSIQVVRKRTRKRYGQKGRRHPRAVCISLPFHPRSPIIPVREVSPAEMVGKNLYAHFQGCLLEETRPLICVGAMILHISFHPRPRRRCSGRGMHTTLGVGWGKETVPPL
ncbi:hypothetical protein Y032_0476g2138 [Ancylostoma ceylanicum]|uniref:Uncharacterized protein n=1 Tax=Ancylostoma ceylanicum TaxID=53326 RepID=A0A016WWG5_9BILA|nr:hypothetical protein Y032_0476g2138 [Ancylostoma ceylanicum]